MCALRRAWALPWSTSRALRPTRTSPPRACSTTLTPSMSQRLRTEVRRVVFDRICHQQAPPVPEEPRVAPSLGRPRSSGMMCLGSPFFCTLQVGGGPRDQARVPAVHLVGSNGRSSRGRAVASAVPRPAARAAHGPTYGKCAVKEIECSTPKIEDRRIQVYMYTRTSKVVVRKCECENQAGPGKREVGGARGASWG